MRLLSGAKDYIDSGLTGDLRNKVGPTTGKWVAPDLDALAERCYAGRLDVSFDTEADVEHVLRCGLQINVNFESAIFDRSLHKNLRFRHRRETRHINGRPAFLWPSDIINSVNAAYAHGGLKRELRRYVKPRVLIVDELGYLPIDKQGADALFQIISQRYEHGVTIISSNRAFKHWAEIFNHDSTLTSALLDRVLHHAETVVIEGKSYRMKDQLDPDPAT